MSSGSESASHMENYAAQHIIPTSWSSTADKQKNCALYEESMKFLAWLADTVRFIFRCGGKLNLASEDRKRSKFKCA